MVTISVLNSNGILIVAVRWFSSEEDSLVVSEKSDVVLVESYTCQVDDCFSTWFVGFQDILHKELGSSPSLGIEYPRDLA